MHLLYTMFHAILCNINVITTSIGRCQTNYLLYMSVDFNP